MSNQLILQNRQRAIKVKTRPLKRILISALDEILQVPSYDLGVFLIGPNAMARINQNYLNHQGPTDVITFDYSETPRQPAHSDPVSGEFHPPTLLPDSDPLQGEIFICPKVAHSQAQTFQTSWPHELTRYALHGVLHLLGYDDKKETDQAVMQRAEEWLVRQVSARHDVCLLG